MANVQLSTLGAVIKEAYEAEADTNAFTDAEKTKLTGIEAGADVTDATNVAAAGASMKTATINTQVDNYTLVLADNGKIIEMNKGTAVNLTVPTNLTVAFPIGAQIAITQIGAGQVTVVPVDGTVTIQTAETLLLAKQYAGAMLYKRGTNEWVLFGNLELA